jgi:hypothetical protein
LPFRAARRWSLAPFVSAVAHDVFWGLRGAFGAWIGASVNDQPGYDYGRDFMKLPRSAFRALQRDGSSLQVYLACLDRARYTARTELIGSRGFIPLEAGEAVFGRSELAALLGLTESKVRTSIERLVTLDIVAIRATSRGTVVKVLGYGDLDDSDRVGSPAAQPTDHQRITSESPDDDQQTASGQPADRQPIATNKTEDVRRETKDVDGRRTEAAQPSLGLSDLKAKAERRSRTRARAAKRAPADWEPRPADKLLDSQAFAVELAKFRDHEFSKARSDWDATWRNWQRNALDRAPRGAWNGRPNGSFDAVLRIANGDE